jgi:hypothetical protein
LRSIPQSITPSKKSSFDLPVGWSRWPRFKDQCDSHDQLC